MAFQHLLTSTRINRLENVNLGTHQSESVRQTPKRPLKNSSHVNMWTRRSIPLYALRAKQRIAIARGLSHESWSSCSWRANVSPWPRDRLGDVLWLCKAKGGMNMAVVTPRNGLLLRSVADRGVSFHGWRSVLHSWMWMVRQSNWTRAVQFSDIDQLDRVQVMPKEVAYDFRKKNLTLPNCRMLSNCHLFFLSRVTRLRLKTLVSS